LKLHVCSDAEEVFCTRDECKYGDFCTVFEGGGEGYAEAVSTSFFAIVVDAFVTLYAASSGKHCKLQLYAVSLFKSTLVDRPPIVIY
jgi:hypothetical protein